MKNKYYVVLAKNDKGYYEIHREKCPRLKRGMQTHLLGEFDNCHGAIEKARAMWRHVDGCSWCCFDCHDPTLQIV